jgi:hypothetical protein
VSSSDRSRPDRVPMRRVVLWLLIAAAIVVGLVFYFRFGRDVSPVLGVGQ